MIVIMFGVMRACASFMIVHAKVDGLDEHHVHDEHPQETGQVAFRGAKRASKGSIDLLRRDSRETGKKNKTPPPRRLGSSSPAQTRGNASATNRHRRCKAVRLTTTKFNPECNAGTIHKKNTNAAAAAAR